MNILFIVVGVGFLALPLGLILLLAYAILFLRPSKYRAQWKQTSGVIEESSVQYEDGAAFAVIRYKFWVDGQPYWGDDLSENGIFSENEPQRIVARYPVGKAVESVFYSPAGPESDSELEVVTNKKRTKSSTLDFLQGVFVLLVFLVLGCLLVYLGINADAEWSPLK